MAERSLSPARSVLRELGDPIGLLLAGAAGVAAWLLHVPGPVSAFAAAAVLAVRAAAGTLLQPDVRPATVTQPVRGPLTRREWEISLLVREGLTNKEIGGKLYISEAAVDSHLAHVREKLGFHSRAEISRWVTERLSGNFDTDLNTKINTG